MATKQSTPDAAQEWYASKVTESKAARAAGCDSHVGHYSWRDFLHEPNEKLPPADAPNEASWQTCYAEKHAPVRLGQVPKNKASTAIVNEGTFDKIAKKESVQYGPGDVQAFMLENMHLRGQAEPKPDPTAAAKYKSQIVLG